MYIHLVRHGQTHWNVQRRVQGQLESELDESGIRQAIERGKNFAHMPLHAAYSSSSVRTRQTIKHILGGRQDKVTFVDELREVHLGIWQGKMWSEIEAAQPDMVEAYHKALPHFNVEGAETPEQTQTRGVHAMEALIQHHSCASADANILVVSHGAIMKLILASYTGIKLTELHTLPSIPNCAHCIVDVTETTRKVIQIAGKSIEQTPWHPGGK